MGTKPYDHPRVDYDAVVTALRELEVEHCCDTRIVFTHPVQPGTPVLLWVKVEAVPRIVGRRTIRNAAAVQSRWPCVDCRYIEALLFRLVMKLDKDLDELGHCPAEQAQFLWDVTK
jgi:hypothetical protein